MQTFKMIVTGPYGAGKTRFIGTISEIEVVSTERKITTRPDEMIKNSTTVAMDFGRFTVDDQLAVHLYGTPGQRRFDFMWDILSKGMRGFVVLVDSTRPETFAEARAILNTFSGYAGTPFVVAANKQDRSGALSPDQVGTRLQLDAAAKVLPCVARDKTSVESVVVELLDLVR